MRTRLSDPFDLENRIVKHLSQAPTSRRELARALKVSRPTLGRALTRLFNTNSIVSVTGASEEETPLRPRGRPSETLYLREKTGYAIGINIARNNATALIMDRAGNVLDKSSKDYCSFSDWTEPLASICQVISDNAKLKELDLTTLSGVGVGIPEPISPHLTNSVEQTVSKFWQCLTVTKNVVEMSGLGESRSTQPPQGDRQLYIRISGGVSCCFTVDNATTGSPVIVGELGHLPAAGQDLRCYCGRTGCLEQFTSVPALCSLAKVSNLTEFAQKAQAGDLETGDILQRALTYLAQGIEYAALLYNPKTIVLGGELIDTFPALSKQIAAAVAPRLFHNPKIVTAKLADSDVALGAVAAVYNELAVRRREESIGKIYE